MFVPFAASLQRQQGEGEVKVSTISTSRFLHGNEYYFGDIKTEVDIKISQRTADCTQKHQTPHEIIESSPAILALSGASSSSLTGGDMKHPVWLSRNATRTQRTFLFLSIAYMIAIVWMAYSKLVGGAVEDYRNYAIASGSGSRQVHTSCDFGRMICHDGILQGCDCRKANCAQNKPQ